MLGFKHVPSASERAKTVRIKISKSISNKDFRGEEFEKENCSTHFSTLSRSRDEIPANSFGRNFELC